MTRIIGAGGGGGCFLGHTLVRVPEGQRRIDELQPGNLVLSFDDRGEIHEAKVLKVHVHDGERVVRYRLWGGAVLDATPNHWVLNQYNAFVEIGTLGSDDCLVDENGHLRPIVARNELCTGTVYNLTVEGHHTFIAGGIKVHNAGLGAGKIIGAGGGGRGKGGGGGQRTPVTAPDTLDSTASVKVIDLLCEGEIQGLKDGAKSIYLNNTQLQNADNSFNFQNFVYDVRNGTQSQSYLPGFNEVLNELPVGVVVTQATPLVRTITRTSVDAVRLTINVPQLQFISDAGDIVGTGIDLRVETQVNGGPWVNRLENNITGRTSDLYQRSYTIPISGSFPINIRVTRLTPDSSNPKLVNAFSWSSYTEITYRRLAYPNSALIGLRVNAEQFGSIPTRSYLIRGLKVRIPNNATVDSSTGALIYSGTWSGTFAAAQWTSDPAWCLYDLLTSTRYGFGNYLNADLLDKWSFYQSSVYCSALETRPGGTTNDYNATTGRHGVPDGLGNYEPRFSCNINIQTSEEAFKLINDMCSVFRAMAYWSSGSVTLSQDSPATPSYLFNLSNVSETGFNYSGSAQKTRATVAVVKYFDMALRDYAYEAVEDQRGIAKYGALTKEIEAFACTSRGQAHRLGEWLLYAEMNETEVVTFTASIEAGVIVRPGQVISIADPVRAGVRRGGRISSATTTAITVDNATGLTLGTTPQLSVILPSGLLETKTVSGIAGNVITVSSAFSATPNANAPWLFQNTSLVPTSWRVLSVEEQDQSDYAVTALQYNSSKYNYVERGVSLEDRTVSTLNSIPDAPTLFSSREDLYYYKDEVRSKLSAGWKSVDSVSFYEVQWRKDDGNWSIEKVLGPTFEILDTTPGVFEFRIYSLNAAELPSSTFLSGTVTALGKTATPNDVTGFTAILDPDIGATLEWTASEDLDLQGYEIWQGSAWNTGTKIGLFQTTSAKVGLLPTGAVTWWIKALDTSGLYSNAAVSVTVTIGAPPAPAVSGIFKGPDVELRWGAVAGSLSTQSYEVRYGTTSATWATATVAGTVQGTVFSTKAAWIGTRRWFVAAIDLKGTYGAAGTWDGTVEASAQPSITQQVVDNNVLLRWNDVTRTLSIESYELRRGTTWETATVIGTKQGGFTSVFETAAGTYTYWLAGIDSAGNYGTPGSVTAIVNQPPDYILQLNQQSTWAGTEVNIYTDSQLGQVVNVDTTETWASHFTSRGWASPQAQITAGSPYYLMPTTTTASYEEEVDTGTVLVGTKLSAPITTQSITGSTTITPTLRVRGTTSVSGTYSQSGTMITVTRTAHGYVLGDYVYIDFTTGTAADGTYVVATAAANTFTVTASSATTSGNCNLVKWTTYAGVNEVYATQFRYIRVRYDFASAGGDDILVLSSLNIRLDTKTRNDAGNGTANSGDVGGTTVTFGYAFIDVQSISVTPLSTSAIIAVYDFVDIPNPTTFKVLLFDAAGNRVSGAFSWSARGV